MSFLTADTPSFLADFGVPATIGAATVQVIFDNGYETGLAGAMDTSGPTATGATADLAGVVKGTAIAIGGVNYLVVRPEPDGTGMTRLVLERAAA